MFPDSGNTGSLGDGSAGVPASYRSFECTDRISVLLLWWLYRPHGTDHERMEKNGIKIIYLYKYIKIKIGHNHSLLKSIIMYKTLEIVDNKQGIFYSCVIVMESVL